MKSLKQFPARTLLTQAGLSRSHWGKRIIAAEKRGKFTKIDLRDACSWVTCACGKALNGIERTPDHVPTDYNLKREGLYFASEIEADAFEDAAETLISIEARAREVLAGIEKKGKGKQ